MANQQQTSKQDESKERERIFNEFKQGYFDIIDEVPLELGRKLSLISELEKSVEECQAELHEDLMEYVRFAKSVSIDNTSSNPIASSSNQQEVEEDGEQIRMNQLLVLAQPMLWGVVKVPAIKSDLERRTRSALPIELRTLLTEISEKMNKLTKLSRDKLDLSESIYQQLDLQLSRLDNDLESYHDLEEADARAEVFPQHPEQSQQGNVNSQQEEQGAGSESESSSQSSEENSQGSKQRESQSSTSKPKRTAIPESSLTHPTSPTTSEGDQTCIPSNNLTPKLTQSSRKSSRVLGRSITASPSRRSPSRA